MLYVVAQGHVDYSRGQDEIVHLHSSVLTATRQGRPWAFTDQHADLLYAAYFATLDDLKEVDWSVMPMTMWGGNDEVKARRQAEFLVYGSLTWAAVEGLASKIPQSRRRCSHCFPTGRHQ